MQITLGSCALHCAQSLSAHISAAQENADFNALIELRRTEAMLQQSAKQTVQIEREAAQEKPCTLAMRPEYRVNRALSSASAGLWPNFSANCNPAQSASLLPVPSLTTFTALPPALAALFMPKRCTSAALPNLSAAGAALKYCGCASNLPLSLKLAALLQLYAAAVPSCDTRSQTASATDPLNTAASGSVYDPFLLLAFLLSVRSLKDRLQSPPRRSGRRFGSKSEDQNAQADADASDEDSAKGDWVLQPRREDPFCFF